MSRGLFTRVSALTLAHPSPDCPDDQRNSNPVCMAFQPLTPLAWTATSKLAGVAKVAALVRKRGGGVGPGVVLTAGVLMVDGY